MECHVPLVAFAYGFDKVSFSHIDKEADQGMYEDDKNWGLICLLVIGSEDGEYQKIRS